MRNYFFLFLILAGIFTVPPGFAQSLRGRDFDKTLPRPSAQALLSVQNDLVAVQVRATNDTSQSGSITYAGLFNIGTASAQPLLFKYPEAPFSSHLNVRVDNVLYSNDPRRTNCNLLRLLSARALGDSVLECAYQAGPLAVLQRLSPQKFSTTTGAILIEFVLHNTDVTNNHQAGVLLELDTFINGNDQAPVLTSFGYSRSEQKYVAPQMPEFLQAFEIGNPADSTGLVAQGTLVGYNAVRPDQLIIGDWSRLSIVQWDYEVPATPPRYDDSAVLLRWNEQNLAAGQSRTVATYYGLGDVTTSRDAASGLTLHLTALRNLRATQGQLNPNPFTVSVLVFNRANASVDAVQASLLLPPQLALASGDFAAKSLAPSNLTISQNNGTASWNVVAQCPATTLDVPIRVQVAGLVGTASVVASVERPLLLPSCAETQPAFRIVAQPASLSLRPRESATFQISMQALFGFNDAVDLSVWPPATPGLATTLMPTRISPAQSSILTVAAAQAALPGQYLLLISGKGGGLIGSDSVMVQVTTADFAAPYAMNFNPPVAARNVGLRADLAVDILDDDAGVDSATLAMHVKGIPVTPRLARRAQGFHLEYATPSPWRDNERITLRLQAQDLAVPPNGFSQEYYFVTVRDSLPPRALNFSPAPFAVAISPQAEITLQIEDNLTGVDFGSVLLQINGITVQPDSTRLASGFALRYRLNSAVLRGDTVRVQVGARDLASQPNAFSGSYFFVLTQDHSPPFVAARVPAPGAQNVPVKTEVVVTVVDQQAGVDQQAVVMEIDGQRVPAQAQGDARALSLRYAPPQPWRYNSTVRVTVQAQDLMMPPNVMPADTFSFAIVQDREPPFVTNFLPAPTAAPVNAAITFNLQDSVAGVDLAAIEVFVNGAPVAPEIVGAPQLLSVRYRPGQDFPSSASIETRVHARDLSFPPNDMPERVFRFTTAPRQPDLIAVALQAVENFALGQPARLRGRIQAVNAGVSQPFRVGFFADGEARKDTTITALEAGQEIAVETKLRFDTPGTHIAEMVADASGAIIESDENNNRRQLVVNIVETLANKLIVRPNPFTPNDDGYNDAVEFNFAGLNVDAPSLQIFDVNGVPVWSHQSPSAKVYAWNGRDEQGRELQPGVYLYTLLDHGSNVASGYVVIAR